MILVVMASILTVAIYGSSISLIHAKSNIKVTYSSVCGADGEGGLICNIVDKKGGSTDWKCSLVDGKWNCIKQKTSSVAPNQIPGSETLNKLTGSQIPLGLKSALDSAIKNQNGGLVIGQNNTQSSNSSQSTINNSPKVSSQSPQTSQSRQTPNTQFGPP
jgi:hypothetical protein